MGLEEQVEADQRKLMLGELAGILKKKYHNELDHLLEENQQTLKNVNINPFFNGFATVASSGIRLAAIKRFQLFPDSKNRGLTYEPMSYKELVKQLKNCVVVAEGLHTGYIDGIVIRQVWSALGIKNRPYMVAAKALTKGTLPQLFGNNVGTIPIDRDFPMVKGDIAAQKKNIEYFRQSAYKATDLLISDENFLVFPQAQRLKFPGEPSQSKGQWGGIYNKAILDANWWRQYVYQYGQEHRKQIPQSQRTMYDDMAAKFASSPKYKPMKVLLFASTYDWNIELYELNAEAKLKKPLPHREMFSTLLSLAADWKNFNLDDLRRDLEKIVNKLTSDFPDSTTHSLVDLVGAATFSKPIANYMLRILFSDRAPYGNAYVNLDIADPNQCSSIGEFSDMLEKRIQDLIVLTPTMLVSAAYHPLAEAKQKTSNVLELNPEIYFNDCRNQQISRPNLVRIVGQLTDSSIKANLPLALTIDRKKPEKTVDYAMHYMLKNRAVDELVADGTVEYEELNPFYQIYHANLASPQLRKIPGVYDIR
jgi:hypothetical protein